MFMRKAIAFIKKDFLNQISYRLDFFLGWSGILIQIIIFYFISKLMGKGAGVYLGDYGGQYFSFVLVGIAFSGYLQNALKDFSLNIRQEQMVGTLEIMLVSPTRLSTIITSMSLWCFIYASISVFIYLLCGSLFFGVDFSQANFFGALVIFILTIFSFSSIGVISASFIVVFKRGDPINLLIGILSSLFGGVYFPISVMPKGLQAVSYAFPITYSLRSLRHALLQGYSFKMLLPDIIILFAFCAVFLPLSISIFKYAVKKAKINGTLAHY